MLRDHGSRRFPPNRGGAVVEHCGKYTVGHGVGRGSRPGYRPWSRGDRAGILPAPAGGVVVAVGCSVFHMRRGGDPWALQVRVLHAPAVAGHAAVPDPLVGVRACTLEGPGSHPCVLSAPLGRTSDIVGPLPQREMGPDGGCRQNSNGGAPTCLVPR